MRLTRLSIFILIMTAAAVVHAKAPLFENFQSNELIDWKRTGDGGVEKATYQGNKTLKLTKRAAVLKRVSTEGYKEVSVSGQFSAWSLEGDEQCILEATVDTGQSWVSILKVGKGQDDGYTLYTGSISSVEFDDAKELILRARVNGDAIDDSCWLDNVLVEGITTYSIDKSKLGDNFFSRAFLASKKSLESPVPTYYFAPSTAATEAKGDIQGRLTVDFSKGTSHLDIERDLFNYTPEKYRKIDQLPLLEMELVQYQDSVLPKIRGLRGDRHPHWELIVEPGKVWQEAGDDSNRVALPFALQQRNSNCTHNGLITLQLDEAGQPSKALYQIGSETCYYFKFNLWGDAEATYTKTKVAGAETIVADRVLELEERIPTKALSDLATKFKNVNLDNIGSESEVNKRDLSVHGLIVDGVHYRGDCNTRFGAYPYCSEMILPSYSTAKSVFGGLALLALEKRFPGVKDALITDLVPACKDAGKWNGVTIEHALNMTTGHYNSDLFEVDEGGPEMVKFFNKSSHKDRIELACGMYKKKVPAGTKWVYHTSDTYLAVTAMDNFLKQQDVGLNDVYDDLLVEQIWKVLGLSHVTYKTRRSYDQRKQGFAGWGLSYLPSDIAKLASALIPTKKSIANLSMLDEKELRKALQMDASDRGIPVIGDKTRYKHAFWAYNVQSALNCKQPLWLPFMSGYGGISVVMMPNNMAYYYFSDNNQFAWVKAVQEAHKLRPMCQ